MTTARSSRSRPTLFALCFAFVAVGVATAGEIHGTVGVDGGRLDHPYGIAEESASSLLAAELGVEASANALGGVLQLSGSAREVRFDPVLDLDFRRQTVGLEWVQRGRRDQFTVSTGLQFAMRRQEELYSAYDHDEWYGYLALRGHATPHLLVRGYVGVRGTNYDALPEESTLEPHLYLEARHFRDGGSALGASVRLGGKWYVEDAAKGVWGTPSTPTTAQLVATAFGSRSLSPRVGVRASARWRIALADFPYWFEADLYDSPLLDGYARNGPSAEAAVKVLGPAQVWVETGVHAAVDDFGAIRFADSGGAGSARRDEIRSAFVRLSRALATAGRGLDASFTVDWRDQASNVDVYDWRGWTATTGLRWRW